MTEPFYTISSPGAFSSRELKIRDGLVFIKTEFLEIKSKYKYHISIYTDDSNQDEQEDHSGPVSLP